MVPRLGGVPVFITFLLLAALVSWGPGMDRNVRNLCLLCIPVFSVGLYEDLTGRAGVALRLCATLLVAGLAASCCGLLLRSVQIDAIDALIRSNMVVAIAVSAVTIGGIPHAINIIDGCNGLAAWVSAAALAGLGMVAYRAGDTGLAGVCLSADGAVLGFMAWNFPLGKLFLGDGGAYLLGLLIAVLSVLLLVRHPNVSPWCPLLLVIYPVWETLFSIWRRSKVSLTQVTRPDSRHLHQLIYRVISTRLLRFHLSERRLVANSLSTVPFAAWSVVCLALAVRFFDDPAVLQLTCMGFTVFYYFLYQGFKVRRRKVVQSSLGTGASPVPHTLG